VEKKVGRNDPCPCGSGKKYKNCHGTHVFGVTEQKEGKGRGLLHIEHIQRARAYAIQKLIALPARKPIPQMERVPLPVGGTISIPKNYMALACPKE
jgi:hypothetical protein